MSEDPNITDTFKAYEQGKHRRYNLLFAVNGGAFAVAKLFTDSSSQTTDPVLGNLCLWQLSLGMALFTIVMVADIFMFGQNMRKRVREKMPALFNWQGKAVLILIGLLIAAAWTLVSFGTFELALVVTGYFVSIGMVWAVTRACEKGSGASG